MLNNSQIRRWFAVAVVIGVAEVLLLALIFMGIWRLGDGTLEGAIAGVVDGQVVRGACAPSFAACPLDTASPCPQAVPSSATPTGGCVIDVSPTPTHDPCVGPTPTVPAETPTPVDTPTAPTPVPTGTPSPEPTATNPPPATEKAACNRGIGNGAEGCDPGNSSGQGGGGGRPAGEDRDEDQGAPPPHSQGGGGGKDK